MCLRAFPFLFSGWGTAVLLPFRNEEHATPSFFLTFIRFNLDWIWLNQTPLTSAFLFRFLGSVPHIRGIKGWSGTSYFWPPEPEKDSCLEPFLLYLVGRNYVSTPPFTTFTTSGLLSGLQCSGKSRAADAPAMLSAMHEKWPQTSSMWLC